MGRRKILARIRQTFILGFVYLPRLDFIAAKLIKAKFPKELFCSM